VLLLAVVEAIPEENLELAKSDKSKEEIEVATTVDDSTFHETVKKHAHAHDRKQKKGHRRHSIHNTNGRLLRLCLFVGMLLKFCEEDVTDLGEGFYLKNHSIYECDV